MAEITKKVTVSLNDGYVEFVNGRLDYVVITNTINISGTTLALLDDIVARAKDELTKHMDKILKEIQQKIAQEEKQEERK